MRTDVRAHTPHVHAYVPADLAYFVVVVAIFLLAPMLIAASASGTVDPPGMPALTLVAICATPAILLFSFLLAFLFQTKEQAAGFYFVLYIFLCVTPTQILMALTNARTKQTLIWCMMLVAPNQLLSGLTTVLQLDFSHYLTCLFLPDPALCPPNSPSTYFQLISSERSLQSPTNAADTPGPGTCIIASLALLPLYLLLIWIIDVRIFLHSPKAFSTRTTPPPPANEDSDVAAERARVQEAPIGTSASGEDDWVRVRQLRKEWGGGCLPRRNEDGKLTCGGRGRSVAVENLTFGIAPGTCFALLGPNGAGKTTAIGMLTGDVTPTAGDAWVGGLSVRSQLPQIFRRSGFCPQFNGLWDHLTMRQHLTFYMRLKGVPTGEVGACVDAVLVDYGVVEHADKQARALSGGTRRKLSAAIAMACGRPDVVFLDEPTTGVDVGTRRFIWDRIKAGVQGRVILLTTHYMDEADHLANVIGIMAKGRLRALGSAQHLKARFGGGYRIECKGPSEHAATIAELVFRLCGGARVLEAHGGTQAFEAETSFLMGPAFRQLEQAKEQGLLENYSLSQCSLEQVFLNIAHQATQEAEGVAA